MLGRTSPDTNTPHHREVLALAFAARVPHREIAEILGVPIGTVKSRLHHARAALTSALAERGYAEVLPCEDARTRHCADALPEYAAHVLTPQERTAVEAHLVGCSSCRAALAGWTAVAAVAAAPAAALPDAASMVRAALTRAALAPQAGPIRKRRASFAGQLLRAEVRLVRPAVWLASVLVMACAVALAIVDGAVRLDQRSEDIARTLQYLLEMALPLVAGVGAASLVGRDPAVELQLTLPTRYRTTILRRLAATIGWVALVALSAGAIMVASGWWHRWPEARPAVEGQLTWLAPTICYSAAPLRRLAHRCRHYHLLGQRLKEMIQISITMWH